MNKQIKINFFKLIILSGFIASIIFHYNMVIRYGYKFPINTFLFNSNDQFMDFISCYKVKGSIYFPFANLLIYFFSLIKSVNLSLSIFLFISSFSICYLQYLFLKDNTSTGSINNTLIFTFFTFPFLFLIDRANFESFVFIFLLIFIYFFSKKRYSLSTIPLALAISMKLFPILFILLFIKNKLWKQIFLCLSLVLFLTIISNLILQINFESYISLLSNNSAFYKKNYIIDHGGLDYGHSLFGLIKVVLNFLNIPEYIPIILTPYLFFVLIIFIIFSFLVLFYFHTLWINTTIIVIMFCLFPYVSADYKLIHFILPILFFLNDDSTYEKNKLKFNLFSFNIDINYIYIILFSIILIPKNYRLFSIHIYDGVIIDPIVMIIFLFLFIIHNYKLSKLNDK